MGGEIILTQPAWLIGACVAAGLLVAALLYWADREVPPPYRLGLGALRGLAVAALAFLLLRPLLRSVTTETQRPVVVVAEDVSASAKPAVDSLAAALDGLATRLGERFDVRRVAVGETVREAGGVPDTTTDAATDLSALIAYAGDNFPPELLAGVVVATDGIYNRGADPTYPAEGLAAPVYPIALGDTTPQRDAAIREVLANRIAYLGDRLEIQVDVQATGLAGQSSTVTLEAVDARGRGRQLASEPVTFGQARSFQTVRFEVEPTAEGQQRYRLSVQPVSGERNRANNTREAYVDVLDARQRVLILAAAPHPDVGALRRALDAAQNYETTFALSRDFDGDVSEVDLVVFHNLPAGAAEIGGVLAALDERGVGRWFVAGPRVDGRGLNAAQELLRVDVRPGQSNPAFPALNGGFRLFTLEPDWAQALATFPPLIAPFAEYGELTAGDVLLTQRIGQVETDYPLLAMGEVDGHKVGLLSGQGLWRWRLAEYQRTGAHEVFDGMVLATVNYLALRADERAFRVASAERLYSTSDDVRLSAELYNASFELVNEPDVDVSITDAEGTEYTYLMDRVGGAYRLRAGRLPAGQYAYRATTSYAGEAYAAEGSFTIRQLQLEDATAMADWALLRRLAAARGGEVVAGGPEAIAALGERLLEADAARPVLYQSVQTRPLIDWTWLLGIVLALLAVEWFLRRRLGTY